MSVIYLSSSYCKDQFPENHGGSFYNTLNQKLHLETGNWHVGLAEVLYEPNSWDNVREGHNTVQFELWDYPIFVRVPIKLWVAEYSMQPPGDMHPYEFTMTKTPVVSGRLTTYATTYATVHGTVFSSAPFFRFAVYSHTKDNVKHYIVHETNVREKNGFYYDKEITVKDSPIDEDEVKLIENRRTLGESENKYLIVLYLKAEKFVGPP